MITPGELHYLDLTRLADGFRQGALSPVSVTEALLARIEALQPRLCAYERVTSELALHQARQADEEIKQGRWRGPLHGVPIALKDNICTRECPSGNGMVIPIRQRLGADSIVASRLREAGAVMLGKLTQTEGAFIEHHPSVAVPVNPWSASAWCGVSSSGAGVATAAGLCFASIGTDTGGSIRMPCDMNGVTGMKPTYGWVARQGVIDNSPSLDHVGPMARSVRDLAAVMSVIGGPDPSHSTSLGAILDAGARHDLTRGIRLGLDERFAFGGVEDEVASALTESIEVLRRCGAQIVPIRFPDLEPVVEAWVVQSSMEIAAVHRETFEQSADDYGPALAAFVRLGRSMNDSDYQRAARIREEFKRQLQDLFSLVDVIALPTQSLAGPSSARMRQLLAEPGSVTRLARYTCAFDMAGTPLLVLPNGRTSSGVPVSFQLVGPSLSEDRLIAIGSAYQDATSWHLNRPPP